MPEVGIIFHDVPDHGTVPDGYQGLWNLFRIFLKFDTISSTKQNDFHSHEGLKSKICFKDLVHVRFYL